MQGNKLLDNDSIHLLVYDFDGVMTDNRVLVSEDGKEAVVVNRGDGLGVSYLKKAGFKQIIISTEENPVVVARAKKLKIQVIYGVKDKKKRLAEYCNEQNIDLKSVLYIGNDLNDYEVMKSVGIRVAPSDAHSQILEIADITTKAKGGYGVIRELVDILGVVW